MILLAVSVGITVSIIARLAPADQATVREMIHRFNEIGLNCQYPG